MTVVMKLEGHSRWLSIARLLWIDLLLSAATETRNLLSLADEASQGVAWRRLLPFGLGEPSSVVLVGTLSPE
jgi:hypothetical protein